MPYVLRKEESLLKKKIMINQNKKYSSNKIKKTSSFPLFKGSTMTFELKPVSLSYKETKTTNQLLNLR